MTPRTLRTETLPLEGSAYALLVHRTQPWLVYVREDASTSPPRWAVTRLHFDTGVCDDLAWFATAVTPLEWLGDLLVVSLAETQPRLDCIHPAGGSVLLDPIPLTSAPTHVDRAPGALVLWCKSDEHWEAVRLIAVAEGVAVERVTVSRAVRWPTMSPDGHAWVGFTAIDPGSVRPDDLAVGDVSSLSMKTLRIPCSELRSKVGRVVWVGPTEVLLDAMEDGPLTEGYSAYYLVSTSTGAAQALLDYKDPSSFQQMVEWYESPSPSGSHMVYVVESEGYALRLYDRARRTLRAPNHAPLGGLNSPSIWWIDDRHLVISAAHGDTLFQWDTEQDAPEPITLEGIEPHANAYPIAVSQGRLVALTDGGRRVLLRSEPVAPSH